MSKNLADIIFSESLPSLSELESRFPHRELDEGATVTRVAPSPTGFMHIGTLYVAMIGQRLAQQSGGVFFLRTEDTDKKREVSGAAELILESLAHYGIEPSEYRAASGEDVGEYGPYVQSERRQIYHAAIKHLLENDQAYACFATAEELAGMRATQEQQKVPTGYYGEWAKYRNTDEAEVIERIENGDPYVIRFKSPGDSAKRIPVFDKILGKREFPENDYDVVIMKGDGLPTYHLAHVVDDYFMRTTLVMRGGEWLPSLPLHIQLFDAFGWKLPKFAHIMPINKLDGGSKRKLSKRKDPESNILYFEEQGYTKEAVLEYLMTLANSKFEPWREGHVDAPITDFELTMKGLQQSSGPLFDFVKLNDISKNVLSRLSAEELYEQMLAWAQKHDTEFASRLSSNPDYAKAILNIERGGKKARKDAANFVDAKADMAFFYDEAFSYSKAELLEAIAPISEADASAILEEYLALYDHSADKDTWFAGVKAIAESRGFATSTRDFKQNPENYTGSMADLVKIFRLLITGREHSPDLYEIMQVMGEDRVRARLTLL